MGVHVENVTGRSFIELISPEIRETLSLDNIIAMEDAMARSTSVWMVSDKFMLGITGVAPDTLLADDAYLWLYTNPFNNVVSIGVVRATRRVVETFLSRYHRLVGFCELSNDKGQRWIGWLGGKFTYTIEGLTAFTIEAKK